jgi:Kef-type K+ transport system membrane component KefB
VGLAIDDYDVQATLHASGLHTTDGVDAVSLLLAFCGLCAVMDASPLLGCMSMAMIYINTTEDDKLFKQINYFSPPFLLLFFVRSGLSFNLNTLIHPSGAIGQTPLLVVGITYFLTRLIGKYAGAYLGCHLAGKPAKVKNYLGLALIPQAGVAIGLATLGNRAIGGQLGEALETIILASSILYELIGPACGKLALYLSGSYQNKLEDIVQVDEKTPEGQTKSQLDLLIERIQIIQEEIKQEKESEEEKAFTEAAEKYEEITTKEDKPNE